MCEKNVNQKIDEFFFSFLFFIVFCLLFVFITLEKNFENKKNVVDFVMLEANVNLHLFTMYIGSLISDVRCV